MKKKREFKSSELVKAFAKIHGFEEKLLAFEAQDFLRDYLSEGLFKEINSVNLVGGVLEIKVQSPLLKNDFRLRKTFLLNKFQEQFGKDNITDLRVL